MPTRLALLLTLGLLVAAAAVAQPLPVPDSLNATLDPTDGTVDLAWAYDPGTGAGYTNGFDTADLTGWTLDDASQWWVDTDAEVLNTAWTPGGDWWWSSAAYTAQEYGEGEFTVRMRRTEGDLNYAQSLFISGDGPFAPPAWTGFMVQIEVLGPTLQYTVIRVTNGVTEWVTPGAWEPTDDLNGGYDAWNTIQVTHVGDEYTVILNSVPQFSWTDTNITMGTVSVGAVGEPPNAQAIEIDSVSFQPAVTGFRMPVVGTPVSQFRPIAEGDESPFFAVDDGVAPPSDDDRPEITWRTVEAPATSELDDFIEFEVYRDGQSIATTTDLSYTDTLPEPGTYGYTVTAVWDEGTSDPSIPAPVEWLPLSLMPGNVDVPAGGGQVTYSVALTLPNVNPAPNVTWWTEVTGPSGTTVPINSLMVNLPAYFQGFFPDQTLSVPGWAPAGTYTFTGHLGYPNGPSVSDSFEFIKQGTVTDGALDPTRLWPGNEVELR